jgi:hypothetical protein
MIAKSTRLEETLSLALSPGLLSLSERTIDAACAGSVAQQNTYKLKILLYYYCKRAIKQICKTDLSNCRICGSKEKYPTNPKYSFR